MAATARPGRGGVQGRVPRLGHQRGGILRRVSFLCLSAYRLSSSFVHVLQMD